MKRYSLVTFLILTTMFNLFGQGKDKSEKEFNKVKEKIFPVIKVESAGKSATMEFAEGSEPVFKKVAGDLLCFYGIDRGDNFVLLTKGQLPASVSMEQLDNIAKENLLAEVGDNLQIHKTDFEGYGFSCGGNHEAALVLLPEIWDVLKGKLGNNIVFGIPSKDMCIFVSKDKEDDIKKLTAMIAEIHKDGERLLSKKLFSYTGTQIEVYRD